MIESDKTGKLIKYICFYTTASNCFLAFANNFNLFFKEYPGTILRVLTVIWIDFEYRQQNIFLSPEQINQLVCLISYHAELNRYFDRKERLLSRQIKIRKQLRSIKYPCHRIITYRKKLKAIEIESTKITGNNKSNLSKVRKYRESEFLLFTNELTNLTGSAMGTGVSDSFLSMAYLTQFLDDCLDIKFDINSGLTTFVSSYVKIKNTKVAINHKNALLSRFYRKLKLHPKNFQRTLLIIFGTILLLGINLSTFIIKWE